MEQGTEKKDTSATLAASRDAMRAGNHPRPEAVTRWEVQRGAQIGADSTRVLTMVHESFARNLSHALSAYLRIPFETSLASTEQLAYREHLQKLPDLTYLASCKLLPAEMSGLLQLDLSIAFSLIDLLLGGEGKGALEPRAVTEIEELVLESVVQIIFREMGLTWQASGQAFHSQGRVQKINASRLMASDDKVLVLSFHITMQEVRGTLQMAVPATVSAALLRKLSAEWSYRKPPVPAKSVEQVKSRLLNCSFDAELNALGLRLLSKDIVHIKAGDLLRFEHAIDLPATLLLGEHPMFQAFVMRHERRRVARLSGPHPKVQTGETEPS